MAEKLIPKCKQCAGTGRVIDDDFTKETIPCESCNNEIDKAVEESISMIKNFTNGYTQCIEDLRNWNGGIDTPLHLDLHNKLITMENSMRERASNLLPTKHLNQFQKLIVQNLYIKKLNLWLDELSWENEKKDRIIENKNSEIETLKHSIELKKEHINDLNKQLEAMHKKYEQVSNNKGKLLVRHRIFPK